MVLIAEISWHSLWQRVTRLTSSLQSVLWRGCQLRRERREIARSNGRKGCAKESSERGEKQTQRPTETNRSVGRSSAWYMDCGDNCDFLCNADVTRLQQAARPGLFKSLQFFMLLCFGLTTGFSFYYAVIVTCFANVLVLG